MTTQADTARSADVRAPAYRDLPQWQSRSPSADRRGALMRGRHRAGEPSLHFVHGNGLSGGVYWPFLAPLSEGYGLITQDLEGHGESDPVPGFGGAAHLTARLLDNLEALRGNAGAVIGVGHSYGAALSLCMAALQPQRFSALVLLDPILMPRGTWLASWVAARLGQHPLAKGTRRRRHVWPDREAVLQHLRGRGVYAGWDEAALEAFADEALKPTPAGLELICAREMEASIYERPILAGRRMQRIGVPALVVSGDRSYPFMPASVAALQRANPAIRTQQVPGGHCFMLERPRETAACIRDFLRTLDPSLEAGAT